MDLRMAEAKIERLEAERDRAREVALRLAHFIKGTGVTPMKWQRTRPIYEEALSYPAPPVTEHELKDRSYQNERFMGGG